MKNTLHLTKEHFIASGAYCECYRHPDVPDQCVKIPTTNKKARKRLKADLAYYKKLHKRQSDLHYIADYLGTVKTNLGQTSIFQCILDDEKTVSKTLKYYLENNIIKHESLFEELHKLAVHLLNNRILISDLHAKNILIQSVEHQTPKPIIVDGIGDTVAITILNIFKSEVHAKIIRRWNKFINILIEDYPEFQSIIQEIYLSKDNIQA